MKIIEKVSVIIPVYNIEDYISECIESILNQSYANLEIICINDGSKDKSLNIIEYYALKDERIFVINQKNQGLSVARNNGIDTAIGKYIYFIDGDDFISENYIEDMVNTITKENTKVVHNPHYMEYYAKNSPKNNHITHTTTHAFETNIITHSACTKLFDLAFLKETKLKFIIGILYEDYEFWNKFIAHLDNLSFCETGMYYYRQRDNSIIDNTKKLKTYKNHIIKCIDSIYSYYTENKNTLNFKPLYLDLLNDHLYYNDKKFRLKFILETRNVLKKFDNYFIENVITNNRNTFRHYTSKKKVLKLIFKAYLTKQ